MHRTHGENVQTEPLLLSFVCFYSYSYRSATALSLLLQREPLPQLLHQVCQGLAVLMPRAAAVCAIGPRRSGVRGQRIQTQPLQAGERRGQALRCPLRQHNRIAGQRQILQAAGEM